MALKFVNQNTASFEAITIGEGLINFPTVDGSLNQALVTDGNGRLFFANVSGSGTSGTSGVNGTFFGSSGTNGSGGTRGTSGSGGSSGTSGSGGVSGTNGSGGTTGSSGTSGSGGTTGSSGTSGSGGSSGSNGSSGTGGTSGSGGSSGISALWEGEYNAAIEYERNVIIKYNGDVYITLSPTNIGETPISSPDKFDLVVEYGTDGTSGTNGTTGSAGTSGSGGTSGTAGTSGSGGTSFYWQGDWISDTNYSINDVVLQNGNSYISLQNTNIGNDPIGTPSHWELMAAKGDAGTNGTAGSGGTSGVDGTNGTAGTAGSGGTSFFWQGDWISDTNYSINDVVTSLGSSYISLQDTNIGNDPIGSPSHWELMAAKGDDGTNGTAGSGGTSGINGTSGVDGYTLNVSEDGAEVGPAMILNFTGSAVTVTDVGGGTIDVNIDASGGGGTNAFIQGGNSFGAQAVLGTNDSNNLVFETNNIERASITDSGTFITGTGAGALNTILNDNITTTDATPTTLLTLPTTNDYSYTVHAYVIGASALDAVGGEVIRTFKNIGGTLTAAGSAVASVIEDFSGSPTFTLTTSGDGPFIILQVTGVASTEINWAGSLRYITVIAGGDLVEGEEPGDEV